MPSYYRNSVSSFINESEDKIIFALTTGYAKDRYADLKTSAIDTWQDEIKVLQRELRELPEHIRAGWSVLLEFSILRRMGRIDAVILGRNLIAVLEFKTGNADSAAANQVEYYALDLAYFHKMSRGKLIAPIVVGSDFIPRIPRKRRSVEDCLLDIQFTTHSKLGRTLAETFSLATSNVHCDLEAWDNSEYHPVPTVIEAAVGMFQQMQVDDIAHADADPKNLTKTIDCLRRIIIDAHANHQKVICFVTGVPGAGKTLAGLKLVHDQEIRAKTGSELAMLSGNGPLVAVLRSALALDQRKRKKLRRRTSERDPKTLIQPVYAFKNSMWHTDTPPVEHVLVFDEAQRAWDQKTNLRKLKAGSRECRFSEPGLILSILSRHSDWAVLVALVGGGQEIHTGEAGLSEWGRALVHHFPEWHIVASPQSLRGDASTGNNTLFGLERPPALSFNQTSDLHLDNPTRQFRGKTVANWTEAVLAGDASTAIEVARSQTEYPICITRSLRKAKQWLREQKRGSERFGLIASSGAKRLRSDGITIPSPQASDTEHWFLSGLGDVRSSFQLEVAATEFQIQGLEIDWAGVCWGGDLTMDDSSQWQLKEFLGSKWTNVRDRIRRNYVVNTYRVLLTRARQGFVIFVPAGEEDDLTNLPEIFDDTADFLVRCGVKSLD